MSENNIAVLNVLISDVTQEQLYNVALGLSFQKRGEKGALFFWTSSLTLILFGRIVLYSVYSDVIRGCEIVAWIQLRRKLINKIKMINRCDLNRHDFNYQSSSTSHPISLKHE